MSRPWARGAAWGMGCAILLFVSSARAGDAHAPASGGREGSPRSGGAPKGSHASKPSRPVDTGTRRAIAGGPTSEDVSLGAESPELRALVDAERELFPPASPMPGDAWPPELATLPADGAPVVSATGLPPSPTPLSSGSSEEVTAPWLARLTMPDLPIRWDERVVRYLTFFRDDPRGHAMFATLYRRSGRWREMIRRVLRRKSLPEDLAWVSMIESGFDPSIHSVAGAAGLWQFMPETAKIYGIVVDRWLDQRMDAHVATEAAADFLSDLHRRFGTWDLALAAFNMGYGGLASVVRRYNTNDFWSLAHTEGTLPWETTLYVPKVLAASVIAHNLGAFGFADLALDPSVETDEVNVSAGTPLTLVAQAANCSNKEIEALNPELRAGRTPPSSEGGEGAYPVKVPAGRGALSSQNLARLRRDQPPLDRYVVRFGEGLDQIAAAHRTTAQKLAELNAVSPSESIRGGTVLLVPHVPVPEAAAGAGTRPDANRTSSAAGDKPSVVVPSEVFAYPDRKRVFYRVIVGDTIKDVASALRVGAEDLCRWNDVDPSARLQEGMTLQAFVPRSADLSGVLVVSEDDVRVLAVGSDEFFASLERDKGFRRVTVVAKAGDTIGAIGRRFDVPPKTMERINRRNRGAVLRAGDPVVVYVPVQRASAADAKNDPAAAPPFSEATPNGSLPPAPLPDLLPLP